MTGHLRTLIWIGLGALVGILIFAVRPAAHALPEYATRTGEPCATCHVNPAGGGPRTVRGSLWIAAGKPDKVPPLPGSQSREGQVGSEQSSAAPLQGSSTSLDERALYEKFACAGCHGAAGEGGAGPALNKAELPADQVTQVIRNGRGAMMAYKPATMSDAELAAVVRFVQAIGRGEVKAQAKTELRSMEPAKAVCGAGEVITPTMTSCGGN
jgi:mono/diheme cytochrome c family protein